MVNILKVESFRSEIMFSGDEWLAGTVTTVSYNLRLSNGHVWKCHQDHLRKCYIDTAESDVVVDVQSTGD